MANHQVMMLASTEVREICWGMYALNLLKTKNHHLEEESKQVELVTRKMEAEVKSKELEVKRQELEFNSSISSAA